MLIKAGIVKKLPVTGYRFRGFASENRNNFKVPVNLHLAPGNGNR